ncbi:MAG: hypothetical protein KC431_00620 [Myxococcales bacterium]|nr:hypothetical protein [Myxococcales bacterium]
MPSRALLTTIIAIATICSACGDSAGDDAGDAADATGNDSGSSDDVDTSSSGSTETASTETASTETASTDSSSSDSGDSSSTDSGPTDSGPTDSDSTDTGSTDGSDSGSTDTGTGTTGGFDFDCTEGLDPVILTLQNNQSARYPTIASAVFAAPDGALVQICPGTYYETVTVDDSITIEGAGPQQTIWQPESGEMLFIDADGVTVRDITFTGGTGGHPSGYNVSCGGAVVIENTASYQITLENLVFDDNSAELGGALCIDGSSNSSYVPEVDIDGCVFTNNTAGEGGAIHAYGRFHIVDSVIEDNVADRSGGGIEFNYGCTTLAGCTIATTSVKRNEALGLSQYDDGGGLRIGTYFNGNAKVTVTNSDFGFGAQEENMPDDVKTDSNSYGFYGNGVSFTCDGTCTAP